MNLQAFDDQCVRITTVSGEVYEGIVSYLGEEYVFHEYGCRQEALMLTPILFYKDDIARIESLEDVNGPFGHFSQKYGLLEMQCLAWGTDLIEEVFASEDDSQICRMLSCIDDHFSSLADRAVPGMAPWRSGGSEPETEDGSGPVYLGELENMLQELVQYNGNEEVVKAAKTVLARLAERFG